MVASPAWAGFERVWEMHGHVGPSPRRPASATELTEGIAYCRRCTRLMFALGKATYRAHLPCTPAVIGLRMNPAYPPTTTPPRPASAERPLARAA
jgi:hypothetical protein